MTRLWAALKRQPVRSYLYGVLVPGEALAVSYGIVTDDQGTLWLALGAAALLVPAAEAIRAAVTPLSRPRTNDGVPLVPSEGAVEPITDDVPPAPLPPL